ncbi:MAG: 16S rRNA (guanine(527)-N(7))-methyltransferase RsmG [Chloroflexota bacterium]
MKELAAAARSLLGISLTPLQITAFETYERELLNWNAKMNLTAIREPEGIRTKHFLDSLTCLLVMQGAPMERVIDVGTGAGFPGLALKLLNPAMQLTLVESVGKKADFCRHVAKTLKLDGVQVLTERAEAVGQLKAHRQAYDWALARAVAVLPVLVEYLLPLARVGGAALAMKGESAPAEAHDSEHANRVLGGHLRRLVPVTLPGVVEQRYLVVVDKVAATPSGYPRRVGLPAKNPLLPVKT